MKATKGFAQTAKLLGLILVLAAMVYGVLRELEIQFPASIQIELGETTLDSIKIYYITNAGWSERNSSQANITPSAQISTAPFSTKQASQIVALSLPLTAITHYRIDPNQGNHSLVIRRLCFSSKLAETCWSAEELDKQFVAFNGISNHELTKDGLKIETEGPDPYFAFAGDDRFKHDSVARLNRWVRLAMSLVIGGSLALFLKWFIASGAGLVRQRLLICRDQGFAMTTADVSASVSLLAIFFSLAWVGIDTLGPIAWTLLVGAMLIMGLLGNQIMVRPLSSGPSFLGKHLASSEKVLALFFALVLTLPTGWSLFSGWSGEFPNVGDHEYHRGTSHSISRYLRNEGWLFIGLPIALLVSIAFRRAWLFSVAAVLLLICYSFYMDVFEPIYRYPTTAKVLAAPFVYLAVTDWFSILDAIRLSSFFALAAWLFLLRPWLLKRWPNWAIMPFALAFCLQGDMAYFFSSVYLEAWSLVFIALAMELLLTTDERNASFKACLMLGVAAIFKEPAVFLIPWFWLAGRPWARGVNYFKQSIVVGIASVLPFLLYYGVRREFGVSRFHSEGLEFFLSEPWWSEMGYRMQFHLGEMGLLMMLFIAGLFAYLLIRAKGDRWALLCVLGSAIGLFTMFNIDFSSQTYTGYFRFYLPIYLLLLAPLLVVPKLAKQKSVNHGIIPSRWIMLSVVVVLVGVGPRLVGYLTQLTYPEAAKNFIEHYDAPIYLPIRDLIEQAEDQGALNPDKMVDIHINFVTNWNQPPSGYPDLMEKYNLKVESAHVCACSDEVRAVIAPFVYYTGVNKRLRDPGFSGIKQLSNDHFRAWERSLAGREQCLKTLRKTCDFYAEQAIHGEVIGAIGID